jgi:hypothetical protein
MGSFLFTWRPPAARLSRDIDVKLCRRFYLTRYASAHGLARNATVPAIPCTISGPLVMTIPVFDLTLRTLSTGSNSPTRFDKP